MKKTCLFASITTFGGYLKVHIPRGLGISTILYGVCGVMCSMPFFLQDRSLYALSSSSATENGTFTRRGSQIPMCDTLNSSLNDKSDSCSVTDNSAGEYLNLSQGPAKVTSLHMRPSKNQISLRICTRQGSNISSDRKLRF